MQRLKFDLFTVLMRISMFRSGIQNIESTALDSYTGNDDVNKPTMTASLDTEDEDCQRDDDY